MVTSIMLKRNDKQRAGKIFLIYNLIIEIQIHCGCFENKELNMTEVLPLRIGRVH